jgi:hypothetical protein
MADDEERADLAERAADLVAGALGSALDAIGRQAIVDCYHALFGDRLTAKRIKNLAEVFKVYQDQTKHLPPEGKRFIAEKIGVRLIQEASLKTSPSSRNSGVIFWPRLQARTSLTSRTARDYCQGTHAA